MDYTTRKGSRKAILVSANPIEDFDGQALGLFSFYYDLTVMRQQEALLKDQPDKMYELADQAETIARGCEPDEPHP